VSDARVLNVSNKGDEPMTDFNTNTKLFLGPMAWVSGGCKVAIDANKAGHVAITRHGAYVTWHTGVTLIGGR
jgi:hypothetical protein